MTIMKKETAATVTLNVSGGKSLLMNKETWGLNTEHVWQYLSPSTMIKYAKVHAPFKITCKADMVSWHSLPNKSTFLKVHL